MPVREDLYATLPDDMLARLLYTGDEGAYEAIFLRYWRPLYTIAVSKTNDMEVAEELVQVLFMQLWENRRANLINHLEAYLKTSLRYKVISFIKRRVASPKIVIEDLPEQRSDQLPDTEMGIQELSRAVQDALDQLPEKTRMIFQMSRFEQRTNSDIAKQLGLTERAIEYHITQCLRRLRVQLKGYLPYATIIVANLLF